MLSSHRHPAGPYPAESSGGAVQGVTQSWHGRSGKLAWSGGCVCGLIVALQGGHPVPPFVVTFEPIWKVFHACEVVAVSYKKQSYGFQSYNHNA